MEYPIGAYLDQMVGVGLDAIYVVIQDVVPYGIDFIGVDVDGTITRRTGNVFHKFIAVQYLIKYTVVQAGDPLREDQAARQGAGRPVVGFQNQSGGLQQVGTHEQGVHLKQFSAAVAEKIQTPVSIGEGSAVSLGCSVGVGAGDGRRQCPQIRDKSVVLIE